MIEQHTSLEFRSAETVRRDGLWPTVDGDELTMPVVRLMALQDVVRRLPQVPYAALRAVPPKIQWHVDDRRRLGQMRPPRRDPDSSDGKNPGVVEFAEVLERAPWPIVVTVVAHELAHVILKHTPVADLPAQVKQEMESWNAVRHWGFAAEADIAAFLLCHDSLMMA